MGTVRSQIMSPDMISSKELAKNQQNMNADIEGLKSSLADIVTVNVKAYGAKGDGVANDTTAIQSAINAVSAAVGSSYNTTYFGVVYLPKGVYNVTNLIMKSNVRIKGNGIGVTRINPIGTSGYVFDVTGTTTSSVIVQVEICDLTISPKDRFSSVDYGTRPNVGGINFLYAEKNTVRNVKINGIAGIGINNFRNQDSYFENIELLYVGTDSNTPALTLLGDTNDSSNANHFIGIHIEACATMLKLSNGARQNQFVGCKFEWSVYNNVPVRSVGALVIDQSNQNAFVGCGFVAGDNTFPVVKIHASLNDIRGLKFTGCDFMAGVNYQGYAFDIDSTALNVNVTGCTFNGLGYVATSTTGIQFNNNEIIDCGTPTITASVGSIANNIVQFAWGTDYVFKLNGSIRCQGNTISARNNFTTNVLETNGISATNDAFILGNNLYSLVTGIYVSGTAGVIRSNRNNATTKYNITQPDYNLLDSSYGSAISPYADSIKYQAKVATNFLGIQVYDGTNFQTAPILKTGTTRPVSGKIVGTLFFDTSLNSGAGMLILWNGTNWINPSTGATV